MQKPLLGLTVNACRGKVLLKGSGHMKIKSYESLEEMMEDLAKATEEANANSKDWQNSLKPGDKVVRYESGFFIYSEILDPVAEEKAAGADEDELNYVENLYKSSHMQGYRFAKSYSVACAEGEYGDIHISTVLSKLSNEQFEFAKSNDWPAFVVRN